MSKSVYDIAKDYVEDKIVISSDVELLRENIIKTLKLCPSYFKLSKENNFELSEGKFYNNFLPHIIDPNINTYEINYSDPLKQIVEIFIGFPKPDNYNKAVLTYDNKDYMGIGIIHIYDNDHSILKSYITYESGFRRVKKN